MNELKKLLEQRSALIGKMNDMLSKLGEGEETRAFTDEELSEFNEAKKQVKSLTDTITAIQEQRSAEGFQPVSDNDSGADNREEAELRSFEKYLRSFGAEKMELRSDVNWTTTKNGDVIHTSIANKIIDKVREKSPLFSMATHYNIGGTLDIPYYDESTSSVMVAYSDEFAELEASAGQFKSISLKGYLAGALSKISRSLINNSNFPIVDYVVDKIAEKFALWIDKELIKGTSGKIEGLSGITQVVTTAASTVITADELIDAQDTIPDVFQLVQPVFQLGDVQPPGFVGYLGVHALSIPDRSVSLGHYRQSLVFQALDGRGRELPEKFPDVAVGKLYVLVVQSYRGFQRCYLRYADCRCC